MINSASRYAEIETSTLTTPEGREIRYLQRRFLPKPGSGAVFVEHLVTEGERLDHLSARYLGDAELFWQLCDLNNAMRPEDLTARINRRLRVALLGG